MDREGSSVRVEAPGQALQRAGGTVVAQVKGVVGSHKPATSVVAEVKKAAEAEKMPWAVLEKEEASVLPASRARRAGVPLPGAVGHPGVAEEAPGAVAVEELPVAAVVVEGEKRDRKK